jgi:hypothetical protein
MKTRKFKGYVISDREPKAGDEMICIQKKNFSFGKIVTVKEMNIALICTLDTKNWKVIEGKVEEKPAKK